MIENNIVSCFTHLIIIDQHQEYDMNWCGKIKDAKPLITNGKPTFVIIGSGGRLESHEVNMKRLEEQAKLLTRPRGRNAVSTDTARIYVKEVDGNDFLLGVMTHRNVKTFAPMKDKFLKS